ncbi:hypothetical protein GCM10025868_36980 [Angustibacter aerolatus]|uniref:HAMP domain-containing protein n=1 Tax=Angustibacter aerolatus TaxID=1162965 RepID=A0ABQ6JKD4_9ACTN|nr:hypothetical protein [Angustibacter aerolatus]GMA88448.1 hypothetical protein GCM10025868_36980 [Angustibacter aerolatus]
MATTALLGMAVVAVVGALLLDRIQTGLVAERVNVARGEAARGRADAQARFDTAPDASGLNLLVNDLLPRLASPEPDRSRDVILLHGLGNDRTPVVPDLARATSPAASCRSTCVGASWRAGSRRRSSSACGAPGRRARCPASSSGPGSRCPSAVTTSSTSSSRCSASRTPSSLVQRTLLGGGVALVLLVGAIAFVVTRQVVTPVRQAALVAGKRRPGGSATAWCRAARTTWRSLARSFNSMADSLQSQIAQAREPVTGAAALRQRRVARACARR